MTDGQLQSLVDSLERLSERLALEERYVDGALVAGGIQAIRALRTKLGRAVAGGIIDEPPPAEAWPGLAVVPPEAGAG